MGEPALPVWGSDLAQGLFPSTAPGTARSAAGLGAVPLLTDTALVQSQACGSCSMGPAGHSYVGLLGICSTRDAQRSCRVQVVIWYGDRPLSSHSQRGAMVIPVTVT